MTRLSKQAGPVDWTELRRRLAAAFDAAEAQARPSLERARKSLGTRAATIAEASRITPGAISHLIFSLADQRYAIETRYSCEVVRTGRISPMPRTPKHVTGLYDLRGQLLPVFDLRMLLGGPATPQRSAIVCGRHDPEFMVLVDAVHCLKGLYPDSLRPKQDNHFGLTWVRGELPGGITLLDGEALLTDEAFLVETDGGEREEA